MMEARMTDQQLAEAVGVDVKSVQRWVTSERRRPHPRHRWAAADALGVEVDVLWPETVRTTFKTGADREVVAVYPYRSACPKSSWRKLITNADSELVFGGYTNYFLWLEQPNLRGALRRKAERGARVRFLVGDPDSRTTRERERVEDVALTVSTRIRVTLDELAKLRDVEGIEARHSDGHLSLSVFRFDDEMFVTPHLAALAGHESPLLHLRRHQDDGLFDRFLLHVDSLWETARPVFDG
ncbi:DUF5919 domain-containing protein [Allonocardiopsis opalescens]|uniref:HTH cro/C1-type domain-containing protein n=1 Tax=Allonocardiopsis opalescens TaxID=1144618 RepID=A0A2T0QEI3_9ACTN|nr:DUF5919 domain-containing protein [Allonocardiopsis opalescens]PRY02328.1 hypothetical protein CLV72_101930 [Allonocardiopsis opalescens]